MDSDWKTVVDIELEQISGLASALLEISDQMLKAGKIQTGAAIKGIALGIRSGAMVIEAEVCILGEKHV